MIAKKLSEKLSKASLKRVHISVENYPPLVMWNSTYRKSWNWSPKGTEGAPEILNYPDVKKLLYLMLEVIDEKISPRFITQLKKILKKETNKHRAGIKIQFEGQNFFIELKTFEDKNFNLKITNNENVRIEIDWWEGRAYEYEVKIFIPIEMKIEKRTIQKILPYCYCKTDRRKRILKMKTLTDRETFHSIFLPVIISFI